MPQPREDATEGSGAADVWADATTQADAIRRGSVSASDLVEAHLRPMVAALASLTVVAHAAWFERGVT